MIIKIGFTGDFCPWERMEEAFNAATWQEALEPVRPFLMANDLNVADLECPLTLATSKIDKTGPHIKAHPETAQMLNFLNTGLVATANNHLKDFGKKGLESTFDALRKNNVQWVGSGMNQQEAGRTKYMDVKGFKLAFINMAEQEWSLAGKESPGCHGMDLVTAYAGIREAKKQADFVIFIAHGGHEHYDLPSPRMKKWYRFFVDAGADAVIGHHTHIISGYERYLGKPVFYGLGNFCFDWKGLRNAPWNRGMAVRLLLEKGKDPGFELLFFEQNNDKPGVFPLSEPDTATMLNRIEQLNRIIDDDELLEKRFIEHAEKWRPVMNTWIQPYRGKILSALHKRGFIPSLIGKKKKLLLANLVRCESHRDILLHALKQKI